MTKSLNSLGMIDAFDANYANFSNLSKQPTFINEVLHKTLISVDEGGTKISAAIKFSIAKSRSVNEKEVILNRPFIYMIIDNTTKMPIFIGTVVDIK